MNIINLLFSFNGRINRQTYLLVSLPIGILGELIFVYLPDYSLLSLVFSVPLIALAVKRLHDRDQSGFKLLLALIPIINIWITIQILFLKGTEGPNRFGKPIE